MKKTRTLAGLWTTLMVAGLAACGGGGGSASSGTLRVALTDAPPCGYDEVNVTVTKVRVHQSASASEEGGGWSEVVLDQPRRINLLTLTNGVLAELGQTSLPAGTYTQLRLVLADNRSGPDPLANSVIPSGGSETALETPSGQQSGLKIPVQLAVTPGQLTDVVLDFDACKSVLVAGKSGQYKLKPVLRAMSRSVTGVAGEVAPSLASAGAMLALQKDGVTWRSTSPTASGSFMLQPVEPGTYTLVLTAPGYATTVIKDVGVTQDVVIRIQPTGQPLAPSVSPSGTLTGTVTTGVALVDATVRALQPLGNGPQIELVARPVDGETGQYLYHLPTGAPEVASHNAGATLTFALDASAAGDYRLEAVSGDSRKLSDLLMLGADATVVTDFLFP